VGRAHATAAPAGITLDTGALIALDRGDKRLIALLDRALAQRLTFRVPSGVVGQAWRDGRVQVTLARFLRIDEVEIVPLDEQLARACGELCGATSTADITDASVVILAREHGDHIVTSDPRDLRRLDPACPIIPI
jgi:predicted nucleic acid-binding protein